LQKQPEGSAIFAFFATPLPILIIFWDFLQIEDPPS
jgi:hypothetical protein